MFQVKVPWILGNVSQAQLRAIDSNHGSAYTEPYNLLFNELVPRKVEGDTWLLAQARDGRVPRDGAPPRGASEREMHARWAHHVYP